MSRRTARQEPTAEPLSASDRNTESPAWQTWGIPAFVGVITLIAFLPTLRNGFVAWDDQANFLENPDYRGLGLSNLRWMWSTFLLGHYVPLSWMTLGLDYVLWGMNPAGYHFTSVLLHSANAVLMYFLARRVLVLAGTAPADSPALAAAAAVAALLFSVHPLRVESVAWITERRDVLSALFYLTALLWYLRSLDSGKTGGRWYWLAIAAYAAALLSKGTSVTLPAVLLVLNVFPLRRLSWNWRSRQARRVAVELLPFVILAMAFVVLTFVALQSMPQLQPAQKVAVSAYSLVFYLWKTLVPTNLVPLYDMPPGIEPLGRFYVGCYVLILAISVAAWRIRKSHPGAITAWVLFVLILLPLLGVHQNGPQVAADRYTYNAAPVLAIALAAAWLSLRRPMSALGLGIPFVAIMVLAALTWRQTGIWRTSERMWSSVLERNDRSSLALTAMGNLEANAGRSATAVAYYERSLAIDPTSPEAENNLGIALSHLGRRQEALPHFERALQLKADDYEAQNNLGLAIADLGGDPESAIGHYRAALAINANYADAHVNWGNALVTQGKLAEAIPHYERAVAINPLNVDAHRNWGVALARRKAFDEAIVHFRRALELRPGFSDVEHLLSEAEALRRSQRGAPPR